MDERQWMAQLQAGPCRLEALGPDPVAVAQHLDRLRKEGIALSCDPDGVTWRLDSPPDLIDAGQLRARIEGALPTVLKGRLGSLDVAWQLDSTNAALLSLPAEKRHDIHVLLAEAQRAGRGRRGRAWQSPLATHLYLSVSWPFPQGIAAMAGVSIATGVLAARALAGAGFRGIGLKWPNDLVTGQGKLGGILVESAGGAGANARAVIGIGVNVHPGPEAAAAAIDQPWDCLDRLAGQTVVRQDMAAALLAHLLPGLACFARSGLAPFLDDYARWDVLAGRPIWLDNGQERVPATALGLAPDGSLRVRQGSVERCVHAGEVSVRQQ